MRNKTSGQASASKSAKSTAKTSGLGITAWLQNARYEVLPTATIEEKIVECVPTDRTITVTASPAKGLEGTLLLAESLAQRGYPVVPHIAARMVRDRGELAGIVARLSASQINRIFVPGGDAAEPGSYHDSLALLKDLATIEHPFTHIGITGYPSSHPSISDDLIVQSMWDKRHYGTHIVSNLNFDPAVIKDWVLRMRSRGITLPVVLGVPGPVERAKMLAMATRIGVGDSTRFLNKHKGLMARLAAPGGFTGERFMMQCAKGLSTAEANVTGIHVYTFNQVAATEQWRTELLNRLQGGA